MLTLQKCNPCDLKIHRVADLIRPFSVTAKYCRSVIQRMISLLFTYGFEKVLNIMMMIMPAMMMNMRLVLLAAISETIQKSA